MRKCVFRHLALRGIQSSGLGRPVDLLSVCREFSGLLFSPCCLACQGNQTGVGIARSRLKAVFFKFGVARFRGGDCVLGNRRSFVLVYLLDLILRAAEAASLAFGTCV